MLAVRKRVVQGQVKKAWRIEVEGHDVPVVNTGIYISETLHELAKGEAFAAAYSDVSETERVYSLRSAPDGEDVGEIARKLGGGGHRHAAGFKVQRDGD